MELLGVDRQQLQRAGPKDDSDEERIPLAPHLLPVVKLFSGLRSQWRTAAGMGGLVFTGLDYSAVEPVMRMTRCAPKNPERMFEHLRTMEMEAVRVLNEAKRG